jgi:hypothetical protein
MSRSYTSTPPKRLLRAAIKRLLLLSKIATSVAISSPTSPVWTVAEPAKIHYQASYTPILLPNRLSFLGVIAAEA